MKNLFPRLLLLGVAFLLGLATVTANAQDLGAVKARMAQRLAKLDEFKAKGVLGENNHGFVELRGSDAAAGDVMAAENKDRGDVYGALAKQTGASAEQVGRKRAKQLAEISPAGTWLQHEDGSWHRK